MHISPQTAISVYGQLNTPATEHISLDAVEKVIDTYLKYVAQVGIHNGERTPGTIAQQKHLEKIQAHLRQREQKISKLEKHIANLTEQLAHPHIFQSDVFELPPEPPVGSIVADNKGEKWLSTDHGWEHEDSWDFHDYTHTWGEVMQYAPLTLVSFASPHVGDKGSSCEWLDSLPVGALISENCSDESPTHVWIKTVKGWVCPTDYRLTPRNATSVTETIYTLLWFPKAEGESGE